MQNQRTLGLNLVSLMNPIQVKEVATLKNSPDKLSDKPIDSAIEIFLCYDESHNHEKDTEEFKIRTIPIEFKEIMGETAGEI